MPKCCKFKETHEHPEYLAALMDHKEWYSGRASWSNVEPYSGTFCCFCGERKNFIIVKFVRWSKNIENFQTPWKGVKTENDNGFNWLLLPSSCLNESSADYFLNFFCSSNQPWTITDFLIKHLVELKTFLSPDQLSTPLQLNKDYVRGEHKKATQINKLRALVKRFSIRCKEHCWKCQILQK